MRFNPFRPNRIAGPGMFAGRQEELLELERCLAQTAAGNAQHFLITGERGIGKSSLLLFLKTIASESLDAHDPDSFRFVVLELELGPTTTYPQIIRQIASALRKGLAPYTKLKESLRNVWDVIKNIEAAGLKYNKPETVLEDFELLDELISACVSATAILQDEANGILILIDEADKAPTDANLGAFVKSFTDRLTKQGCDNVCVGLAGVTGIVQRLRQSHESAPRVFTILSLKPLEPNERKDVVNRGLEHGNSRNGEPVIIASTALDFIADLSEGFPHFIQQFAYCAFEQDTDNFISDADVARGALDENGALDQLGEKYFHQMYFDRINSNEYRSVLQAMAQSSDGEGWVTKEEIRRATGLKETTLGNAIYTLKDREIILPKPGEKGVYRLPNQSFAAWIRARQTGHRLAAEMGLCPDCNSSLEYEEGCLNCRMCGYSECE
jgi:hypothetical protein